MSIRRTRFALPAAVLVAVGIALAGCSTDATSPAPDASSASSSSTTSSEGVSNDADVAFLEGMYPHHAQALQMAAMVPGRTNTPGVLGLAEQITRGQQPEMDTMVRLLESFGRPAPSTDPEAMGGMAGMGTMSGSSMPGMMTDQDMSTLATTSGTAFDQQWLTMMIEHHNGAIDQATTELAEGINPEARDLATAIISAQETEIDTMTGLLES